MIMGDEADEPKPTRGLRETYPVNERRKRKSSVERLLKATDDLEYQAFSEGVDSISHETFNRAKSLKAYLSNLRSEITADTFSTTEDCVEAKKEQSAASIILSRVDEGLANLHEIMSLYPVLSNTSTPSEKALNLPLCRKTTIAVSRVRYPTTRGLPIRRKRD